MFVDPQNITNFSRTLHELEAFLLFVPTVAGKNSDTQAEKLNRMFEDMRRNDALDKFGSPFDLVRQSIELGTLEDHMRSVGLGQYGRLPQSFEEIVKLDPNTCTIEDLEKIHGIGLKSSRFFIVHSRKDHKHAIIDTHILKFLRDNGVYAPEKSTPTDSQRYAVLEKAYVELALETGMAVADHDLMIWKLYRTK